jgi:molecular chaperone GrpE
MESLLEESEGSLSANAELEEALREAAEAVDDAGRVREHGDDPAGDPPEVEATGDATGDESQAEGAEPAPEGGGKPASLTERLAERLADLASPSEDIEKLQAEAKLAQERLMRMQADFENFRRRALKERTEDRQYGHQNLVKDLLSTVDNLDRAIDHAQGATGTGETGLQSLLEGVELVRRELLAALAKHGVSEIEAAGQPFDPSLHEAMAQREDLTVAANTVVEVLEKGYQLRSRLVRPSRVIVAQGGPTRAAPDAPEVAEDEGEAGAELPIEGGEGAED